MLDTDTDEEDESETQNNSYQETEKKSRSTISESDSDKNKSQEPSRQITLPHDYNKLEIPKLENVNLRIALKNTPEDQIQRMFGMDLNATLEKYNVKNRHLFESEITPLDIQIDVKVRSVRDVDEINELKVSYNEIFLC